MPSTVWSTRNYKQTYTKSLLSGSLHTSGEDKEKTKGQKTLSNIIPYNDNCYKGK